MNKERRWYIKRNKDGRIGLYDPFGRWYCCVPSWDIGKATAAMKTKELHTYFLPKRAKP